MWHNFLISAPFFFEFMETGYEVSLEIDYKMGILLYHSNLANRLISRGKYEKGFEHLETASEICKETGNDILYSLNKMKDFCFV